MPEPIVFVDSSEIREGRLDEVKVMIHELTEFVETNEPRPILYQVFLDQTGRTMTVVQVHPDSESMEMHMDVAQSVFSKFQGLLQMRTMDIYGKPSQALLAAMTKKAEMLGASGVTVHDSQGGFSRL
jgi:hypothetical protein